MKTDVFYLCQPKEMDGLQWYLDSPSTHFSVVFDTFACFQWELKSIKPILMILLFLGKIVMPYLLGQPECQICIRLVYERFFSVELLTAW